MCKVRRITLNYTTSQIIFDMILKKRGTVVVQNEKKTKRKIDPTIVWEPQNNQYKTTIFKRRRLDNNDSLPFGLID